MEKTMEKTTNPPLKSVFSTALGIDVKRCLCVHAMSQLIEIALQSLLYQRQIIPEPVASLIKSDSHAADQFKTIYEKVTRILQETFRTPNTGQIAEFVILIGGTPYTPKEIYRIPVPICTNNLANVNDQEERENEQMRENGNGEDEKGKGGLGGGCGPACEELSAKERRLVFSAVALSKTAVGHFENCPMPGKTDKVFMFVRARGPLNTWTEGLLEDESFELPDDKIQQRRKIRQLRVEVHSACCIRNERGRQKTAAPMGTNHQQNGKKNGNNGVGNGGQIVADFVEENGANNDGGDSSEWEEAEENVLSIWYRIAPFFAALH